MTNFANTKSPCAVRSALLACLAMTLFLVIASSSHALASDVVVDMTTENALALKKAVVRLQQTELLRVSRGRLKPNPIVFPLHLQYQIILQNQGVVLDKLTSRYENALSRLQVVLDSYPDVIVSGSGRGMAWRFRRELAEIYRVEEELEKAASLLEVWSLLESSGLRMEALPVRARLALNAQRWMSSYFSPEPIPNSIEKKLDVLMQNSKPLSDPFSMEVFIAGLSTEYAELFADELLKTQSVDERPITGEKMK